MKGSKKQAKIERKALAEKKKEEKKALKQANKEFRQSSTTSKRVAAAILWILIVFFFAKGLIGTITAENSDSVKETLNNEVVRINEAAQLEKDIAPFAQSFVFDYFTYDSENADNWASKMRKYMAENITLQTPTSIDSQYVNASEVKKIIVHDKSNADVDILAKITTSQTNVVDGTPVTTKTVSNHIIRVPIVTDDGNCAVIAPPVFVADTNIANKVKYNKKLDGESASTKERETVKKLSESFLNAYFGTKPSELKYYITKDFGSNATIGGNVTPSDINSIEVVKHNGKYEAKVEITVTNGAMVMPMTYYLTIEKGSQNRLYVSKLDTRPSK